MVDDIRAPAAWRRPKTKIYDYNQDMGCAYYKVWAILNFFLVLLIILVSNIEMFGFSPWSTMWTQKSDREYSLSDRWVFLESIGSLLLSLLSVVLGWTWTLWIVIDLFWQTEKVHLPHPAELVMMSHEAGLATILLWNVIRKEHQTNKQTNNDKKLSEETSWLEPATWNAF